MPASIAAPRIVSLPSLSTKRSRPISYVRAMREVRQANASLDALKYTGLDKHKRRALSLEPSLVNDLVNQPE